MAYLKGHWSDGTSGLRHKNKLLGDTYPSLDWIRASHYVWSPGMRRDDVKRVGDASIWTGQQLFGGWDEWNGGSYWQVTWMGNGCH